MEICLNLLADIIFFFKYGDIFLKIFEKQLIYPDQNFPEYGTCTLYWYDDILTRVLVFNSTSLHETDIRYYYTGPMN